MFIELHNDASGLQHMIAVECIESFQLEYTLDEHTRNPVFCLSLHLKNGKSYELDKSQNDGKIKAMWQKLGKIVNCTEHIAF